MALVEKSVLVGYSAERMYGLVDDVERYPEFLPWCGGTMELRDGERHARLDPHRLSRHQAELQDRKPNPAAPADRDPPGERTVSPPGRLWRFTALAPDACKIEFRLHYEFSSQLLEKLVGPVFKYIANTLLDAFLKRAEQLVRNERVTRSRSRWSMPCRSTQDIYAAAQSRPARR